MYLVTWQIFDTSSFFLNIKKFLAHNFFSFWQEKFDKWPLSIFAVGLFDRLIGVYFNNALNALSALANNIAQCVFRNILKYHNSNISKTHWKFNIKYRNISITHWDSQCVFEIFMYFEMYFLMNNQFQLKHCVFQNIANAFLKYSDIQNLKNFKYTLRL